ncbi:hypothetical protein E3P99_02021 [Wallemia hederae]|uniref:HSF-type DNA-binding domain-containing protein n=1 Tax=Wallemia hederae TaxID=1540922 RepID=A0A4T0FPU2_9BASI|nr:hypothetical protein E3P99_02021 [Wallemia hederae]
MLPSINSASFTHLLQPSDPYQPSPAVPQQTPATATATKTHSKKDSESGGRFPDKLFHLLENPDLHNVIAWSDDGKYVLIHDPVELEKVMGTMWRSSAYPTFQRQMNLQIYGFSRTSTVKRNKPGQANRMMPSTWSHPTISRGSSANDLAKIERNAPRRDRKGKKGDYSRSYDDDDEDTIKHKSRNSTTLTPALNNVSLPELEPETPHESRKHLHNDDGEDPPAKRARRPSVALSRSAPSAPAMTRNLSMTSYSNSVGLRTSKRLATSVPRENKMPANSFTQMRSPHKSDVFSDDEPEMAVLLPQIEDEEDDDDLEYNNSNNKRDSASGEELSSDEESEDEDHVRPMMSSSLGLRTPFGTNTSKASTNSMDILAAAASIRNPVPTITRRSSNFLSMNPIGIDARKQFNEEPSSFDSDSSIFNQRRSSYKDSFLRSQPNPISIPSLAGGSGGVDSSDGESFDEESLFTPPNVAAANYHPPTLDTLNNVAAMNAKKEGEKTRKLSFLPTFSFFTATKP